MTFYSFNVLHHIIIKEKTNWDACLVVRVRSVTYLGGPNGATAPGGKILKRFFSYKENNI